MNHGKRNLKEGLKSAQRMVDLVMKTEPEITQEERDWVSKVTYSNFERHINKGFLDYRKSVTETGDFALADWYGEGSVLRDVQGREYLDMLGGFGLYSLGIRHPTVVAAAKAQLDRSPQYSQEMLDPLRAHLASVIAKITPGDIQYGFFANSGTEAVDGAMKLARLHTTKKGFISTLGGFHGKSLASLSLLGKASYREPFLPLLNDVHHAPYGDSSAVEMILECAEVTGSGIAGVVVEPVQGEAGAVVPPDNYWPELRRICDKYGVLLIADEVQTGFGRTGKLFGVDHWNVTPDIMCFGKALGGGVVAMSGFFATPKVWKCMEENPFMHTTTTGGNPLACAAALASISVILKENLAGVAAAKGIYLKEKMQVLKDKYPHILTDFRGLGLLTAMVFPDDDLGYKVAAGLFKRGVLTAGTLNNCRTIRIEPALNVPYEILDEMLKRLDHTFASISA